MLNWSKQLLEINTQTYLATYLLKKTLSPGDNIIRNSGFFYNATVNCLKAGLSEDNLPHMC
jgi:hypothetical protein